MTGKIPYIQNLDAFIAKAPLPCPRCDEVTAHDISAAFINAIVGTLWLKYSCNSCGWEWQGRVSIVDQLCEFGQKIQTIGRELGL